MKTLPLWNEIERVVVYPIETGFLVEISTDSSEENYAYPSYRLVLEFLKQLEENEILWKNIINKF